MCPLLQITSILTSLWVISSISDTISLFCSSRVVYKLTKTALNLGLGILYVAQALLIAVSVQQKYLLISSKELLVEHSCLNLLKLDSVHTTLRL